MAIGKVIGRIAIKVLPDTTDFKEKTKNDLIKIASQLGELEVDVVPEVDKQAKDKVKDELQRWARGLDLKAKLKLDFDNKDLTGVEAALDGVARKRTALIKPELDNAALLKIGTALAALSGVRAVTGMFEKFREELLSLDQAVPTIGVVSNSIGSLIGVAASAAGSLFSLGESLVQMSAAGLALPGMLGGVAIGLGVAAVALADFKKEVPQISAAWSDLRTAISDNFWDVAGDGIRSLVDELFPTLAREASNTATVVGGFFGSLAKSLEGRLLPAMSGMFDNLNKSVKIFTGHTDAIANIITILGDLGSKYLPALATSFGNVTQQFSDWLTAADKAGKLTEWVDEGIERIKELGRIIGGTASIFSSLADAAEKAGGATLGSVADGIERIAKAAESPGFQRGLTDTLRAAYDMMDQISSRVGPSLAKLVESLSETFQEMAPVMGDTVATAITAVADALSSPALQNGLKDLLSGFNRMVHELAPAMQPLADKLGALGTVVGELADTIGQVLGSAIEAVSPTFIALAEAITPIVDRLGPMLSGLIDNLAPAFETLAGHIDDAAPKLEEIADAFADVVDEIGPLIGAGLEKVVDVLGTLANITLSAIAEGMRDLADGISDIKDALQQGDFKKAAEELPGTLFAMWNPAIAGLADKIRNADWTKIGDAVKDALKKLTETDWNDVGQKFGKKIGETIQNAIVTLTLDSAALSQKLAKWISEADPREIALAVTKLMLLAFAPQVIVSALTIALWQIGQGIMAGIIDGLVPDGLITRLIEIHQKAAENISAAWDDIKTRTAEKWEAIKNTVVTKAENLRANAVQKFENLKTNASQKFESIRADITQKLENLRSNAIGKFESLRAQAVQKAENLRASAVQKFESIRADVIGKIENLRTNAAAKWESIRSTAASKWESIKTTIGDAAGRFKTAVADKVDAVVSTMRDLPGRITRALGDLGSLLWDAGASLLSGLIDGIDSKIDDVKAKLQGLTAMLPDWKGPADRDAVLLKPAGQLIIEGLVDGLESRFGVVRSALMSLTDSVGSVMQKGMEDAMSFAVSDGFDASLKSRVTADYSTDYEALRRQVTSAARDNAKSSDPAKAGDSFTFGNITISLEDLKQLNDLQDFLDLLRVRTLQGEI